MASHNEKVTFDQQFEIVTTKTRRIKRRKCKVVFCNHYSNIFASLQDTPQQAFIFEYLLFQGNKKLDEAKYCACDVCIIDLRKKFAEVLK